MNSKPECIVNTWQYTFNFKIQENKIMNDKMCKHEGGECYPTLFRRLFDDDYFSHFMEATMPAVNVKETKSAFKLEVSAPGFEKNDFKVNVDRNILTISAEREHSVEKKDDDEKILRQEFSSSTFSRSFTLPEHVDTDNIEAKEKNGVLTIKLPKRAEAKEKAIKQIEIK